MKMITIQIPETLYKAVEEYNRVDVMNVRELGAIETEDEQKAEIQRKMNIDFERAIFNYMEELVGAYFRDFDCPEHKQYEKVFGYLREYLDEYFKRIETIKRELCEKYRKENNGRTTD